MSIFIEYSRYSIRHNVEDEKSTMRHWQKKEQEGVYIASTTRKFTIGSRQHPGGSGERAKKEWCFR